MIERFFRWPIAVRRKTGQSATAPVYGDWDTSIKAKIRTENRVVVDADGNEVLAAVTLQTFVSTPQIPPGSLVTLPSEFGGITGRVIAESPHDSGLENLPAYYEFHLGG